MEEHLNRLEKAGRSDLLSKSASLLAFDFEAAVALKNWESLEPLIEVS